MSERNNRKVYTGRVVSDKMDKTITVVVETYKQFINVLNTQKISKLMNNQAKIGDAYHGN